jgi:hypothetical protein
MAKALLMPKATAVWLVDNTALTFEQIADFCGLHMLEVKGIADGDVAQGIRGLDPITSGQVTREEIERGQSNPEYRLHIAESKVKVPEVKTRKGPRYTPLSRRQDRPNAILWLLRNHPELKDSQIIRLVGTTKPTIQAIRERTHWNSPNLQPQDPVTLGLCSQLDLDAEVKKAARRLERERKAAGTDGRDSDTLLPAEQTIGGATGEEAAETPEAAFANMAEPASESESESEELDADSVFAKLQALKGPSEDSEEEGEDS